MSTPTGTTAYNGDEHQPTLQRSMAYLAYLLPRTIIQPTETNVVKLLEANNVDQQLS